MKSPTFASMSALLEEIVTALVQAGRYAGRAIATMSWPQMIAVSIALALVITIVPLALCLFIVFLIVKLAVAAIVLNTRRHRE